MWLRLVERYIRDVEAARSNRVTPMKERSKVLQSGKIVRPCFFMFRFGLEGKIIFYDGYFFCIGALSGSF